MAVPVQIGGTTMDREFQYAQEWFTPKRIKRILQEWYSRYEPWTYKHPDEDGINYSASGGRPTHDRKIGRIEVAGSVQWSLNKMAWQEPELYDVIIGFYLDVELVQDDKRPHVMNMQPRMSVFELAEWQGIHPRTCYKRELRAREWLAQDLGWVKPGEGRE